MNKRWIAGILITVGLLAPMTVWAAGNEIKAKLAPHITMLLEGRDIGTPTDLPISYNGKTYVPLRLVSESLGYEVGWDGENYRIDIKVPEEDYPLIKNDAVEIITTEATYDFITSLDSKSFLGGINLDFSYTLTEDVARPPVIVMETLNNDHTVLASETKLLKTKAGTYTDYIIGDKNRLPYSVKTAREDVVKLMTEDYYYRITIK
ncbi:copper amine oxidase N-terminal domain-containing protein [Paenibacillus nanensis]|uniref:Copper amine oxidase N-terminal domain-containing protein n=1 Tax=Paenibacillus nanensis TaxID=393251 RepID=A0A3A1UUT7_9BACL|nr:stalk domain-containing protein [Paenibacillus nanensis]RIX51526.1 copper amine oxidase N-terminal domain-containing protein [Paenibacillus nanensis]